MENIKDKTHEDRSEAWCLEISYRGVDHYDHGYPLILEGHGSFPTSEGSASKSLYMFLFFLR